MGAESPSLGIPLEKPSKFPVRHFLTRTVDQASWQQGPTASQSLAPIQRWITAIHAVSSGHAVPCTPPLQPGLHYCQHTALNPFSGYAQRGWRHDAHPFRTPIKSHFNWFPFSRGVSVQVWFHTLTAMLAAAVKDLGKRERLSNSGESQVTLT